MDTNLDLRVLNLHRALVHERLKNCELLHESLVRRVADLKAELEVVNEEIAKLTPKPPDAPAKLP